MIKLLFLCHGNICRSPMAEFVMKDLVRQAGLADHFQIASAATSTEEIGNPVYPPVRHLLAAHGLDCTGKTARQMTRSDYDRFDLLLGMDNENLRSMRHLWPNDPQHKLHLLLEYTDHPGPVADPWYTRDFEAAWQNIADGCQGLLDFLCQKDSLD